MNFGETAAAEDRRTRTIHLQGLGRHLAKPAGELSIGDRTVWNYGYVYVVESIVPSASGKTLDAVLRAEDGGQTYPRRFAIDRMVAIIPTKA